MISFAGKLTQIKFAKPCKKNLFLLSKLQHFTDIKTRKLFYNAYILPHIDYSSTVWDGCSAANLKKLNSLHRRSAKLVIGRNKSTGNTGTDSKLHSLSMLELRKHFLFSKLTFMQKVILQRTPAYISAMFKPCNTPDKTLRNDLAVPKPRLDIYKTSLSYSGAEAWNKLPRNFKVTTTPSTFRARLLEYMLKS